MRIFYLLMTTLYYSHITTISMVYNFRIAQVTKQTLFDLSNREHTVVTLLFDQYQKKYSGTKQNFAGALGSYIHDLKPYYYRIDWAAAHIHDVGAHHYFDGANTDDILITAGRNMRLSNNAMATASGLLGIPTHAPKALKHADFGYGQVGLGVQLDGCYTFDEHKDAALLYGARSIFFVPRNTQDVFCNRYRYSMGNIADILIALKNYWGQHGLEAGYTARTNFGAAICPDWHEVVEKTNYVRSNFYLVYKYKYATDSAAHRLLFNVAYGFDHKSKLFGNKCIITVWGSWVINF